MSASLVGSEMCIRDREALLPFCCLLFGGRQPHGQAQEMRRKRCYPFTATCLASGERVPGCTSTHRPPEGHRGVDL
eukprot:8581276-Alexandrium_andersonii.AAC.1